MEGVSFVVATLLGTFKRPKLTNITTGKFTGESLVFHTQGEKYEKNVVGHFEKQFETDIAELDQDDELVFDEDELM